MFEILMYLFESYFDSGSYPELDKLSRKLSAAGFEEKEISDALSWLSALQQQDGEGYPAVTSHAGHRHYAPLEIQFMGEEARNYLVFAEHQKLISATEREMIIDRAVALRQEDLTADKIKLIMLMVLWDRHQELDPLLVEELLSPLTTTLIH